MKSTHKAPVFFVLALLLSVSLGTAQTITPPAADQVLNKAVEVAKSQQKNVLIVFGASWCSWCKRLDAMLVSPEVGKLFQDSYVIDHLTIQESKDKLHLENPGAQELVDNSGGKGSGVPVYIFFDNAGKRLATSMAMPGGKNIGHPATPEEIDAFDGLLEKTAPRMSSEQRLQVKTYLKNQKL